MADLAPTAAQVAPVNETQYVAKTFIAAVAITAGQAVYENSSGKAALARANATGTVQAFLGIATHSAAAGKPVEVMIQGSIYGMNITGMAYGAHAYVSSATAGAVADTIVTGTGNFVVPVGRVMSMTDGSDLTKVLFVDVPQATVYTALP
jgi:hypothetical protein